MPSGHLQTAGTDGVGLVSQRSFFPTNHMLRHPQECLSVVILGELAEEVLSVPCWVGERSGDH